MFIISTKILFLTITFLSFAIAGLLLIGNIDPDFFSYYYVGRGIIDGQDMYHEFADNKGPVLYLFFAFLYFLFGNNYNLAIFVGNGILDAISIYFLFRLFNVYGLQIKKFDFSTALLILFSVLLYKSFSISSFIGGVYSEQLGMTFFIISLWKYENKNHFIAGLFFALSILTRASFLFFIVIFPVISLIRKRKIRSLFSFWNGIMICVAPIILFFLTFGSIGDFIYNNILYSLQNSGATSDVRLSNLIGVSSLETRIFLVFLYVTYFVITSIYLLKDKSKSLFIVTLYIASIVVTNPGGIFYSHHFLQFMVITFIVFALFRREILKTLPILVIILVFVVGNYVIYSAIPKQSFMLSIPEASEAEYLMIVPYYPRLYFIFNKAAPDRYYQPFFLLDSFNKNSEEDVKRHKTLSKEKLKNTLFMMVEFSETDKEMTAEYLQKFGSFFHLERKKVYQYENGKVELYSSQL